MARVPFMSLTASAPDVVETDIVSSLLLTNVVYIKHPLNRSNIYMTVKTKSSLAVSTIKVVSRV